MQDLPLGKDFTNGFTGARQCHGEASAEDRMRSMRQACLSRQQGDVGHQARGWGPATEVIQEAGKYPGGSARSG